MTALRAEVAIHAFGPDVRVVQDFAPPHSFNPPHLAARGGTPLAEGISNGIDALEERIQLYQAADLDWFRPCWILSLCDWKPTSTSEALADAADRIREVEGRKRIAFHAVVTDGGDMDLAARLSVRPPARLRGLDYRSLFRWLSCSITTISHSMIGYQNDLPDPTDADWARK